jgi:hypothetical protein
MKSRNMLFDENPIHDVRMVNVRDLLDYGFTEQFRDIVIKGFPDSGSYKGLKMEVA